MYDKGGVINRKYFISRRWMENSQEARPGGKRESFWKKIYTPLLCLKWNSVFKLHFEYLSFLVLSIATG